MCLTLLTLLTLHVYVSHVRSSSVQGIVLPKTLGVGFRLEALGFLFRV